MPIFNPKNANNIYHYIVLASAFYKAGTNPTTSEFAEVPTTSACFESRKILKRSMLSVAL
jgi:hypothetical protein